MGVEKDQAKKLKYWEIQLCDSELIQLLLLLLRNSWKRSGRIAASLNSFCRCRAFQLRQFAKSLNQSATWKKVKVKVMMGKRGVMISLELNHRVYVKRNVQKQKADIIL